MSDTPRSLPRPDGALAEALELRATTRNLILAAALGALTVVAGDGLLRAIGALAAAQVAADRNQP